MNEILLGIGIIFLVILFRDPLRDTIYPEQPDWNG